MEIESNPYLIPVVMVRKELKTNGHNKRQLLKTMQVIVSVIQSLVINEIKY